MATPTKTQTKAEAWQVACADSGANCAFMLRTHDKAELARSVVSHVKSAHGKTMGEKDVLAIAKPSQW
ncbi:MAG: DUF1059 domain-containing protein [Thermoplasmatota archaeon]